MPEFMGFPIPTVAVPPGELISQIPVGFPRLPTDERIIDDGSQVRDCLRSVLDWHKLQVTPKKIAIKYSLRDGETARVKEEWRTRTTSFNISSRAIVSASQNTLPMNPVVPLTEGMFRINAALAVSGYIQDWANIQFNGNWCVKDYTIELGTEGDDSVRILSGGRVSRSATIDETGYGVEFAAALGFAPEERGALGKAAQRSVYKVTMILVDIFGLSDVEYEGGKPLQASVKAMREQSRTTAEGMAKLAQAFTNSQAPKRNTIIDDPEPEREAQAQTIDEAAIKAFMAERYGISGDALDEALLDAKAKSMAQGPDDETFTDDIPRTPGSIFLHPKTQKPTYKCPVCGEYYSATAQINPEKHLLRHRDKEEITHAVWATHLSDFRVAFKDFNKKRPE